MLNLLLAVHAQTLKLLGRIQQAHSPDELWSASDRAEGLVLGVETVKALNRASIEAYMWRSILRPLRGGWSKK